MTRLGHHRTLLTDPSKIAVFIPTFLTSTGAAAWEVAIARTEVRNADVLRAAAAATREECRACIRTNALYHLTHLYLHVHHDL